MFEGARLILLTTTGARTGSRHTVPVGFLPDPRGGMIVIASAAGAPRHPAWYHNLVAEPRVTVETGVFTIAATAEVLAGAERDAVFARAVAADPGWGEYQAKTDRVIPVVALRPVSAEFPDLPEGDVLTLLHDAFRRELAIVRDEVAASGAGIGAQLRINCLAVCGGLHHHHSSESGELFPHLRDRRPELDPVLDRLEEEHAELAALLDRLQDVVSATGAEPGDVLADVDRLVADIEAHLAYEEQWLVPVLNALPARDADRLTVTRVPVERSEEPGYPSAPMLDDATLVPALPHTGGVPGQWVNATGRTADEAGVALYVHGGGFEHTNPEVEHGMAYHLSKATDRPVYAVAQRLAPADPYPAALDDVVAGYLSMLDQGVPASRVVLVGESSGGTLVLSALLALRDAGSPLPAAAVAVSPVTDLTLASASFTRNDGTDVVDRSTLERICKQYLAGAPADAAPQSPLHGDLAGLPPLLLAAGTGEVLVDDARRFAAAAAAAGVRVALDLYEGMRHAFHVGVLADPPTQGATAFFDRLSEWVNDG